MQLVKRDIARLIINQPFFATILLTQKIEEIPTGTACVDGTRLCINMEWYSKLTDAERMTVLAHEAMHLTNMHHLRQGARDMKDWNIACDLAINPFLESSPFQLIDGALTDPTNNFGEGCAERIYLNIKKKRAEKQKELEDEYEEELRQQQQATDSGAREDDQEESGQQPDTPPSEEGEPTEECEPEVEPHPMDCPEQEVEERLEEWFAQKYGEDNMGEVSPHPEVTESNTEGMQQEMKQEVKKAIAVAKARGRMPAGIEAAFDELLTPTVNWRDILSQWIDDFTQGDYSWLHPNPIHLNRGIVMPTLKSEAYAKIVIGLDTSGSMSDEELQEAVSEIMAAFACYMDNDQDDMELTVIYCDSEVSSVDVITHEGQVTKPTGRGGTCFMPVFEYIENMDEPPEGLIYITDGYADDFPEDVPCETLWMLSTKGKQVDTFHPPFGMVLKMEESP